MQIMPCSLETVVGIICLYPAYHFHSWETIYIHYMSGFMKTLLISMHYYLDQFAAEIIDTW